MTPTAWGFIGDLRECIGKTIERVELTDLGFGYTVDCAWTIKFTDGSRAFVVNRPTSGLLIEPNEKALEKSKIFKPEELGELVAAKMRAKQERAEREEAQERHQLAKLQKKYQP